MVGDDGVEQLSKVDTLFSEQIFNLSTIVTWACYPEFSIVSVMLVGICTSVPNDNNSTVTVQL